MAWTENNNNTVYERIERVARRLQAVREEIRRLDELSTVFASDITDQADGDHLKSELVSFKNNIMEPLADFFGNSPVTARNRSNDLQEWIVDND